MQSSCLGGSGQEPGRHCGQLLRQSDATRFQGGRCCVDDNLLIPTEASKAGVEHHFNLGVIFKGEQCRKIKSGLPVLLCHRVADPHVVDVDSMRLVVVTVESLMIQLGEVLLQKRGDQRLRDANRMSSVKLVCQQHFQLFRAKSIVSENEHTAGFQTL